MRAVMPPAIRALAAPPWASRPVHFRQVSRQPSCPSRHLHFPLFPIPAAYGSRSGAMPRLLGYSALQVQESARMLAALQSPGSRRSVAPHRLCAPQPPLYSPALPRGCNRPPGPRSAAAPTGDLHPLPSAPLGLPLRLRAAPDDRFAATGATLRLKSPLLCPVPADVASLRLPGLGLFHGRLRVLRKLRSSAQT